LKIFKKVVLAAQLVYYKERFDTKINTTKQLWINLNKMSFLSKPKSKTNIDKLTIDNKDITESNAICNASNEYFCAVGPELAKCSNPCGEFALKYIYSITLKIVCFVIV